MATRNPNDAVNTMRRPRKQTFEEKLEDRRRVVEELHAESAQLWDDTEKRIVGLLSLPKRRWTIWVDERDQVSSPIFGRRGRYVEVVEV